LVSSQASNAAGKSTFSQTPTTLANLVQLSSTPSIEVINPDTVTHAILPLIQATAHEREQQP
jgi:hypothetical protein